MFFKKKPTEIPRLLKEMEEHPENFKLEQHLFTHSPSGVVYWVATGLGYYGVWKPIEIKFNIDDQKRFHAAFEPFLNIDLPEIT